MHIPTLAFRRVILSPSVVGMYREMSGPMIGEANQLRETHSQASCDTVPRHGKMVTVMDRGILSSSDLR